MPASSIADRLIVALDVRDIATARKLVERLDGTVSFYKIGLWLAFAPGIDDLLRDLAAAGKRIFLDTKMYDIGQTVEQGVARAAERGINFVTVHGDEEMLAAAVRGRGNSALQILAVTVLTSLGDAELAQMGYRHTARELVDLRTASAVRCGCDGIIASPADDPRALRAAAEAPDLLVVTPGVRRSTDATQDHKRHATPTQAIARGADYLVVGRPIVAAPDPLVAARAFVADMEQGAALQVSG
jgi:orotidine-5'-phosphate decarboxylase